MANMSSFYGGRSAPSFTIVKSFDGVDIPSNRYTKTFYAIDNKNKLVHGTLRYWEGQNIEPESIVRVGTGDNPECIIRKTRNNFAQYNWRLTENNGAKVDEIQLPQIFAKGMLQCFSEGVATLDEVNYQEYVLIDTITNLNEYSNPDNGKIYRRGFDVNNGMQGAEYIGRITGPQGYNTGIQLDTFSNVGKINNPIEEQIIYSDLVPGGVKKQVSDESTGEVTEKLEENRNIECVYANVLDESGNVLHTKIGFKFPYLVNTFKSDLVAPYGLPSNLISETDKDGNILSKEHSNNNPFYRHWSIKIPYGKKGDSVELIRKQPTVAPEGINYYTSLYNLKKNISPIALESSVEFSSDKYLIDEDDEEENKIAYIKLEENKFVKAEDCTNNKVFYKIRNYNTKEEGILSIPIEIGDIDSIIKTNLDKNGILTIYYDNGKEEIAKNKIRWINDIKLNTEGDNPNYKLHVTYNTLDSDGRIEEKDIGKSIRWIENLEVNKDDKKLYVTYNIPKTDETSKIEAISEPIRSIENLYVDGENKKLCVTYNTPREGKDSKTEEISEPIRWIENLQVNSGEKDNQKLHVTYNTPKANGVSEEDIGVPINFIKELYIGTADDYIATKKKVKPNCLYVRYSDPNFYSDSNQYITIDGKQWVELGILTPPVQGLKILKEYSEAEFTDEVKHTPPEVLFENTAAYGGAITVAGSMHIFDYLTNQWTDTKIVIGEAHTILDNYVSTNTNNDNNFLINNNKSALSDTLPLKLNQEDIASSSNIEDFNNIDKQGIYSIQKDLTNKPSTDSCVDSNLIVLKINDIIHQIFLKDDKVYSRYRYQENTKNIWTSWKNNIGTDFKGSNTTTAGIRGLVPAPPTTTETDNYFLKSNGYWTDLNGTFARLGKSETFTDTPVFSKGFTSQGTTVSTFTNAVSITAADSTDKKALSVTNGISAGNISASGNGKFSSINIGNTEIINDSCVGKFASITSTSGISITNGGVTADNGVGQFASISATGNISTSGGDISTSKGDINTSNGNISATGSISTDNGNISATGSISTTNGNIIATSGDISTTNGNISASGNGKFGSINIGDIEVINSSCQGIFSSIDINKDTTNKSKASISATGVGKFSSINIGNTEVIDSSSNGKFSSINIGNTEVIDSSFNGKFSSIEVTTGSISVKQNGSETASISNDGKLTIKKTDDIKIEEYKSDGTISTVTGGAVEIKGGMLVKKSIYSDGKVYNAVWNDLADSIIVNKDAKIEAGYCYCLKDNKYVKSSKYLDNGIIGIHSDTYGFKMGDKIGEKQLDCAVAGFVLAYVDKDYLPGTALTCTKDGRLTKMKSKDKQRFPEKIVATYWKDEPNEEWGSDNRKVKVNGRKWVKIK